MNVTSRKFTYLPSLIKSIHSPVKGLLVYLDTHDPQGDFFQLTSYNSKNYFQNFHEKLGKKYFFPAISQPHARRKENFLIWYCYLKKDKPIIDINYTVTIS